MVRDPARILYRFADLAGVSIDPTIVKGRRVYLQARSHAAVGNPVRGGEAVRMLTRDDRWKAELPKRDQLAVQVLTGPTYWLLGGSPVG